MDKVKHIIIGDFKCSKRIIQTSFPSSFLTIVVQQYFEIFDNFCSHDVPYLSISCSFQIYKKTILYLYLVEFLRFFNTFNVPI